MSTGTGAGEDRGTPGGTGEARGSPGAWSTGAAASPAGSASLAATGGQGRLRLVLATANPDKAAEIVEILGGVFELEPRPAWVAEVEETGETLLDNARLKARALAAATGLPAVADDTGLEVAALGGAPGVNSARYAGEGATYSDNVAKLLSCLEGCRDRAAVFRTVAVVAWPDGREVSAAGSVEGYIKEEPAGSGGFGYDPVFVPEGEERTFAEMTPQDKHALSHRGRAFRALRDAVLEELTGREGY